MTIAALTAERKLQQDIAGFYEDPRGYVMYAFPWGEPGTPLEDETGPDIWQIDFMESIRDAIMADPLEPMRFATASGHGIGKTAQTAWIVDWYISTRAHSMTKVTANTSTQLRSTTWRELAHWHNLMINKHWFEWSATKFKHVDYENDWYAEAIPNTEKSSESFAGHHDFHMLTIFDEGSAIPDKIWEVAETAQTTPRSMFMVFGNPTRSIGRFKTSFTTDAARWNLMKVDSRNSKLTSKKLIEEWRQAYGEDSDFFRVRVLGEFPTTTTMQLIAEDKIDNAMSREIPEDAYRFMPLTMGVDVARGGDVDTGGGDYGGDMNVIALRRGRKLLMMEEFPGMGDILHVVRKVKDYINEHRPDIVYCDSVGNAAGVVDVLRNQGFDIVGVNAHTLPDKKEVYFDKRIEMWDRMKRWMETADMTNVQSRQLKEELVAAQFGHTRLQSRGELLILEKKKHITASLGRSPDKADALSHTFWDEVAGERMGPPVGDTFGGAGSVEPDEAWA